MDGALTNLGDATGAAGGSLFLRPFASACFSYSGGGVGRFFSRVFGSDSASSRGRFTAPAPGTGVPLRPEGASSGTRRSLTVRSPSLRLRPFSPNKKRTKAWIRLRWASTFRCRW